VPRHRNCAGGSAVQAAHESARVEPIFQLSLVVGSATRMRRKIPTSLTRTSLARPRGRAMGPCARASTTIAAGSGRTATRRARAEADPRGGSRQPARASRARVQPPALRGDPPRPASRSAAGASGRRSGARSSRIEQPRDDPGQGGGAAQAPLVVLGKDCQAPVELRRPRHRGGAQDAARRLGRAPWPRRRSPRWMR
jgi:hypothetical protein